MNCGRIALQTRKVEMDVFKRNMETILHLLLPPFAVQTRYMVVPQRSFGVSRPSQSGKCSELTSNLWAEGEAKVDGLVYLSNGLRANGYF